MLRRSLFVYMRDPLCVRSVQRAEMGYVSSGGGSGRTMPAQCQERHS